MRENHILVIDDDLMLLKTAEEIYLTNIMSVSQRVEYRH